MGLKYLFLLLTIFCCNYLIHAQSWVVKDSILVFPQNFSGWLKANNGGIDLYNPGSGNSFGPNGSIGTNQGVDVFDFNKDGKKDLIFQLFPSNNITREYLRGIFIQNNNGQFVLDTNYIIKGKGDMWYGGFGDFNGDGLIDYHYLTENYHGADSNRKFNPEMISDNWPDRVFINNGKSFDTLSLDNENLQILSSYISDIDKDGSDEIITTSREGRYPIVVYKYNKILKKFYKINNELTQKWISKFEMRNSDTPIFNVSGVNNSDSFTVVLRNNCSDNMNPPFCYTNFTYVTYSFKDSSIKQIDLNREEWQISPKYSKEDVTDSYKYNLHQIPSIYKIDLNKDGIEELVTGGFYMNDYSKGKQRYAYGWKALSLNGKDITTQVFIDSGFDRNVDLISHALDIDQNSSGIEFIPGTWGADGGNIIGTVGYYYRKDNNKLERYFIRDIKHELGKRLDSTYFRTMQIVKYPDYKENINALLLYDFQNIQRAAILYQADCKSLSKPIFDKSKFLVCGNDSVKVTITNFSKTDSTIWYSNSIIKRTNTDQLLLKGNDTFYVKIIDKYGCIKYSDTSIITKLSIPNTPSISRDADNNLVSNSVSNIWYKDGVKIADTTQKIKPTTNGIYTATTTQNGCISALSQGYYYLTNAVANLSNGEYFKISPNPTSGEFNINYKISSSRNITISVFDINGRAILLNKKVESGTKVNLGTISKGNYLIQVKDGSGRLISSQKLVKD